MFRIAPGRNPYPAPATLFHLLADSFAHTSFALYPFVTKQLQKDTIA